MNPRETLAKAKQEKFSLGAFNAGNFEIIKAIFNAAKIKKTPLIIQSSGNEAEYLGMENFLSIVNNLRKSIDFSIITNLDHGPDLTTCQKAIDLGYDMVHFDGSSLPLEENVKIAKALVQEAHEKGILVEGEINRIPGSSKSHSDELSYEQSSYTDPEQAFEFVSQTGVDALAVFVGNLHGTYPEPLRINLNLLKDLSERLDCFLCLHGGSGVQENDIKEASGLVSKINVNTELRIAYKETLENVLKGSEDLAIYKIMPPVIAAVERVVEEKINLFRSKNQGESNNSFGEIKKLGESYEV